MCVIQLIRLTMWLGQSRETNAHLIDRISNINVARNGFRFFFMFETQSFFCYFFYISDKMAHFCQIRRRELMTIISLISPEINIVAFNFFCCCFFFGGGVFQFFEVQYCTSCLFLHIYKKSLRDIFQCSISEP